VNINDMTHTKKLASDIALQLSDDALETLNWSIYAHNYAEEVASALEYLAWHSTEDYRHSVADSMRLIAIAEIIRGEKAN
jgi:hypothetical protein